MRLAVDQGWNGIATVRGASARIMAMHNTDDPRVIDITIPHGIIVAPDDSIRVTRRLLQGLAIRSVLVVDAGRLAGTVCWTDLERMDHVRTVREVMNSTVPILRPGMTLAEAWDVLIRWDVNLDFVPVVAVDGRLLGQVPRSAITMRERRTDGATRPFGASWVQLSRGMRVVGSDRHRLGLVRDLIVDRRGNVRQVIVEHGWFGWYIKRLPADVITEIADSTVRIALTGDQFKGLLDEYPRSVWWQHVRVMR